MQVLNNLFKVGWRWKNASIICYILMSLVYLQQENVKKYKKLMKLPNLDEQNHDIFRTTWGNLMTFSGKMCLIIILKVTKKQGLSSSVENKVLKKLQGQSNWSPSPSLFRVNPKNMFHQVRTLVCFSDNDWVHWIHIGHILWMVIG